MPEKKIVSLAHKGYKKVKGFAKKHRKTIGRVGTAAVAGHMGLMAYHNLSGGGAKYGLDATKDALKTAKQSRKAGKSIKDTAKDVAATLRKW